MHTAFFRVLTTHNTRMRKFADKLKELRKENEWTQKELADRLQITRASVASWETEPRGAVSDRPVQDCRAV